MRECHTSIAHIITKHGRIQVLARARALDRVVCDSRLAQTESDHWRRHLKRHKFRLAADAFGLHQLMDIRSSIVAMEHSATAALDPGP